MTDEAEINPWRRIRELEAALRHQRELTASERRRADSLEERSRIAWRVSAFSVPRREKEPEIEAAPGTSFNRTLPLRRSQTMRRPDPDGE